MDSSALVDWLFLNSCCQNPHIKNLEIPVKIQHRTCRWCHQSTIPHGIIKLDFDNHTDLPPLKAPASQVCFTHLLCYTKGYKWNKGRSESADLETGRGRRRGVSAHKTPAVTWAGLMVISLNAFPSLCLCSMKVSGRLLILAERLLCKLYWLLVTRRTQLQTLVLSVCLPVCLSIRPSVRLSVRSVLLLFSVLFVHLHCYVAVHSNLTFPPEFYQPVYCFFFVWI